MSKTMLEHAIEYAQMGLAVFPLEYKGKRPVGGHGVKDATTNLDKIREWWGQYQYANIGIAMGKISGNIFAVDVDNDDEKGINGSSSLRKYEKEHGELPETAMTLTGRKGNHLLYYTDRTVGNRVGVLEGIDIRGEGGYIVAPPSVHPNGNVYDWENPIDEFPIAEADENVLKLLTFGEVPKKPAFELPEIIKGGARNTTLFKYACSLQSKGYANEDIMSLVVSASQTNCFPPIEQKDLEDLKRTIASALKYEKGIQLERDDNGKVKQTIKNAETIFECDPKLSGICFNEFSYSVFINGSCPWETVNGCREWDNHDKSYLMAYMESKYGLRNERAILNALDTVSYDRKFNPIKELLEALPKWDGKDRISTFLSDYLGADDPKLAGELFKLWLLGAINRAYHPGIKFDYMLVLVGGQGIGKSYFLSQLAMNAVWYDDNFTMLEGKESVARLRGKWIVEWDELNSSGRKKDIETIKSFITSTFDNYRPPYKEVTETRPRMCVFAGTTNDRSFLTDPTGNRRFLPIHSNLLKSKDALFAKKSFSGEIQQLWAQALHIFKTENPPLIVSRDMEERLQKYRERFIQEDPKAGLIRKFFEETSKTKVCSLDAWRDALGETRTISNFDAKNILTIMRDVCESVGWHEVGKSSCDTARNVTCFERDFIKDDEILF